MEYLSDYLGTKSKCIRSRVIDTITVAAQTKKKCKNGEAVRFKWLQSGLAAKCGSITESMGIHKGMQCDRL